MDSVFYMDEDIVEVGSKQLESLKIAAKNSTLRRSRLCLHRNTSDQVQEMVIAFCKDSYVRPHRHINKSESFHIIDGELIVVFFNNDGHVTKKIEMGPVESSKIFIYRLNSSIWHTIIPISDYVLLHETTAGPFVKSEADYPEWAPKDVDLIEVKKFLKNVAINLDIK